MKKTVAGLKWINNGERNKRVKEEDINTYLEAGWCVGQLPTTSGYVWINDGKINKTIKSSEVDRWLDNGWIRGKISSSNEKDRIRINNGKIERNIKKDDLDEYIAKGYLKGALRQNFRWITNGVSERWTDDELPVDWHLGRLKSQTDELISMFNSEGVIEIEKRYMNDYLNAGYKQGKGREFGFYKGSTKNTKWMFRDNETKVVRDEDIKFYLDNGWAFGNLNVKDIIHVYKDNIIKYIKPSELESFLDAGWVIGHGNIKNKTLGMRVVSREDEILYIEESEIDKYLSLGYSLGTGRHTVNDRIVVHNSEGFIYIDKDDLKDYIGRGYSYGRLDCERQNFFINNGFEEKYISIEDFYLNYDEYSKWELGKIESGSIPEKKFHTMLNNNNIQFSKQKCLTYDDNRRFLYDICVGSTLVEINPSFTHCTRTITKTGYMHGVDNDYHLNKTLVAEANGFNCIHVWDWDNKEAIINLLKPRETIYARQCLIRDVSKSDAIEFLNNYHIQGYAKDSIRIGLYFNNKLVSLMTFGKPRYNNNVEYELIRYCSIANVIGGSDKLFSHFINTYKPKSVVSYCDISKFKGSTYEKLGFSLINLSKPSVHWFNDRENMHITDNLLRQRGYDQLFGTNYGKGTSNEELMINAGFVKIYDCGQKTFIWRN